jgi:hypothetical protein
MRYNLYGDYAAVYGLEDIRSCVPLTSGEFMDLVRNFSGIQYTPDWVLRVEDPLAAQPLLNLLNVKYLLASPRIKVLPGVDFRVTDRSDFGVLENLEVWPRAFFTDRVVPVATTGEFIQRLMHDGPRPFAALTAQEIATQPGLAKLAIPQPAAAVLAATNYVLRANSTAFDVHAPTAGVVCLTEGQARDFTATANGESKTVLTVNRAFKGIYLDRPGDYHVKFTYRPRHWRLAVFLFWLAAGGVTALGGIFFWRAPIQSPRPILP